MSDSKDSKDRHEVVFTVDKQRFSSPTDDLTPRQILVEYAKTPTRVVEVRFMVFEPCRRGRPTRRRPPTPAVFPLGCVS